MFPSGTGKRIVLVTDGNETTGDAAEAADVARADGIQIDYVPPPDLPKDAGEVVLSDLSMPSSVTKGEPFSLRVTADVRPNQQVAFWRVIQGRPADRQHPGQAQSWRQLTCCRRSCGRRRILSL